MFWVENVWHVCIVERTVGKKTVGPSEEVMTGSVAEWSWRWKIPPPSVCGLCLLRQAHLSGWRSWVQLLAIVSDFLGQNSLLWNYFLPFTLPLHSPDTDFFLQYINTWVDTGVIGTFLRSSVRTLSHSLIPPLSLSGDTWEICISVSYLTYSVDLYFFPWDSLETVFHNKITAHLHGGMYLRN